MSELELCLNGFDLSSQFTGGAHCFDVSLTGTYYNGYDDNTVLTQAFKEGANSPFISGSECVYHGKSEWNIPTSDSEIKDMEETMDYASTFWLRTADTFVSNRHS
ncbi:hypothetical protein NXW11_24535 [Bacteroides thetaiotaomicron]|nr:hypothetical protein [Bacteroides thetaiotaomicron]